MDKVQPSRKRLIATVLALYVGLIAYKLLSESPEEIAQGLLEQQREDIALSLTQLSISDPNLLACIKKAAAKHPSLGPASSKKTADIRDLKSLYCRQKNIQSLAGIEKFEKLVFLNISNNRIEDIAPLASSTQLKTLHLAGNPLTGISALKNHTSLEALTLPKLPNIDCIKIKSILKNAIKLRLPPCKQSRDRILITRKQKAGDKAEDLLKESRQLSDKEEKEILDYEYEMLRQID